MRLPVPFANYRRTDAISKVGFSDERISSSQINRLLYDGDHWLGGEGFIGPVPKVGASVPENLMEQVQKVFCSRNVVAEVIDRKVDGLLKSRPHMKFSRKLQVSDKKPLTDQDEALIAEASDLFQEWFKKRKMLKQLKKAYGCAQLGEKVTVRLYVPRGLLENGKVPKGTIEESIDRIHVDIVVSNTAGEITDPDTQLKAAVCEVTSSTRTYTEIVYTDGEDTIVRSISTLSSGLVQLSPGAASQENADLGTPFTMRLGGRLTMYEPHIRPVITQQVRENQMAINLAKTMQNRNTVTAGFLERIILDAMPPGRWKEDPEDPNNEVYEVGPFSMGAGTTNFFAAMEYRDKETGESKFGNPSVYFKDPVSPETFIASKRDCYQDILEEVGQPHILISSESTPSGKSREEARETYRGTLEDDEGELNPLISWLMETVMWMGSFFSGEAEKYKTLVAESKCTITLGPLSGNDRQDNREDVKAGQLSVRTSMMRSGVEDPQAELDRIAEEAGSSDEVLQRKTKAMEALIEMGFEPMGAAKVVGLSKEQAANLKFIGKPEPTAPSPGKTPDPESKLNNPEGKNTPI